MSTLPQHALAWFELPVSNLENGAAFYGAVLQAPMKIEAFGPMQISIFPTADPASGVSGNLYEGTPSPNGARLHLAIADSVEAARDRVFEAGGTVQGEPIQIPEGRMLHCADPDGNPISLFERAA